MESPSISQGGRQYAAGFFFSGGMNSAIDPQFISERQYAVGYNIVNRSGIPACRPGFESLPFCLPYGPLQGGKFFVPTGGVPHLVFAVAGKVYASRAPFKDYFRIPGIQFRKAVDVVHFEAATQSAVRNSDGTISTITPKNVLMMQDGGYTRAAVWDGGRGYHLDPGPESLGTPPGGAMLWSGNRLWVAQKGGKLVVGDIANPLAFSENQYLADGQPFLVDAEVTALSEIPSSLGLGSSPQMVAFTDNTFTVFQSGIRDRSAWKTTRDFQKRVFQNLGCTGHRAVVEQYGQLWFFSGDGLVALDSSLLSNSTSSIRYRDTEMAVSKAYVNKRFTKYTALGAHGNFLLVSVPSGAANNRHTWVMDQSVADSLGAVSPPAWASIWTGLQPVEWISGVVEGSHRTWCISRDFDGRGRIWEAFSSKPLDNGKPIRWAVETRAYAGSKTGIDLAKLDVVDVHFLNILGETKVSVDYASPWRGAWKTIADRTFLAGSGGVVRAGTFTDETEFADRKPQSRVLRSVDVASRDPNVTSPELKNPESVDYAHQLRIRGFGPGAVRGFRMAFDPERESSTGACAPSDTVAINFKINGSRK